MLTYTETIEVERPLDEVIRIFDDAANLKAWMPGLKEVTPLEGEPGTPGATAKMVFDMGKRRMEMVETIVERVDVPVTAKMRLGTGGGRANNSTEICERLQDVGAQRLCIHGRTLRQRYSGEADWTSIKEAVDRVEVPVIANGDVVDAASASACLEHTGASGLMIGRGAIGRPTVFSDIKVGLGWMKESDLPWVAQHDDWHGLSEIGQAFASRKWCWDRYIALSEATVGIQGKWMQRHAIAFTKGLPGAKKVRTLMHEQETAKAMADAISRFLAGA